MSLTSNGTPQLIHSCQGHGFTAETLTRDALAACGANYNSAYFELMGLPISDLLWHIYQWVELQKIIHPETDNHRAAGLGGVEFEPV